ncbi:MAG: response regulator [Candidatus Lambdaproteobacteria bacterium]|nr:response regulator [Candidatus Lambdaproteobacteria bacterium]
MTPPGEQEIQRRLAFLDLSEEDWARLREMHAVIHPHRARLIEDFYRVILAEPELAKLLADPVVLKRLQQTQAEYISSLLTAPRTTDYFRQRLRIGTAHHRIGLDSRWFIVSYHHLERLIGTWFVARSGYGPERAAPYLASLHRAVYLEIGFTSDAYVQTLSEQLRGETEEALKANRMKSEFLSRMSHELRTPLNAIINFTDYVRTQAADQISPRLQDRLQRVLSNADHLLALINDILDMSRLDAGRLEIHREAVPMAPFLDEIARLAEVLMRKNENAFAFENGCRVERLFTDPIRLRQILHNLLTNAAKFTRHGTVRLEVGADDGRVHFAVHDTGVGIAKADIPLIFQEFRQLPQPNTVASEGTGLGLAISQQLCTMLGSTLEVESEPGRGSSFRFSIPISSPEMPGKAAAPIYTFADLARVPPPRAGRRVMVIDDDPDVVIQIHDQLGPLGYVVVGSLEVDEGLALAREIAPVAILLDIKFPRFEAWSVIHQIKNDPQLAGVPVIVISSLENRSLGRELGAAEYLVKPIRVEQLRQALYRVASVNQRVVVASHDERVLAEARAAVEAAHSIPVEVQSTATLLRALDEDRTVALVLDCDRFDREGLRALRRVSEHPRSAQLHIICLSRDPERHPIPEHIANVVMLDRGRFGPEFLSGWLARIVGGQPDPALARRP